MEQIKERINYSGYENPLGSEASFTEQELNSMPSHTDDRFFLHNSTKKSESQGGKFKIGVQNQNLSKLPTSPF